MTETMKHPTELKRGDEVSDSKGGVAYEVIGNPITNGGYVSAKVAWSDGGGHAIRQWDLALIGDQKVVPVRTAKQLDPQT